MTYEEAEKMLEDKEGEYMKNGKQFTKGLGIIEEYSPVEGLAAEHDVLYVSKFIEQMSEEHILQLYQWGFHLSEESWAYFT